MFFINFVLNSKVMKTLILVLLVFLLQSVQSVWAQEKSIPYSQSDRDRMVRVETQIQALDKRIDDVHLQINRLEDKCDSYFMWGFGLVLMSIFGLIGFVIYNRRTTLAPVENKTERIIKALREASEKDPVLMEALKRTALW